MGLRRTSDLSKSSFGKLQMVISRLLRILAPPRKLPLGLSLVDSHPAPPFDLWVKQSPTTHQPSHPLLPLPLPSSVETGAVYRSRENSSLVFASFSSVLAGKNLVLPPERLNFQNWVLCHFHFALIVRIFLR